MDRLLYYRGAEDVVPRDVVHVIICGSVTIVPNCAFKGYQNLVRVQLQEGVKEIGAGAFRGCHELERVDCPSSMRRIHRGTFAMCLRLSEVILREGLQWIRYGAFYGCCHGLEKITLPSSVVEIGDHAFSQCRQLSEVNLQEGLLRIGEEAFKDCGLRRIAVPPSVVEIGEDAFTGCNNLEAVTLSGGMVMVARRAFFCCPRLEQVAISSAAIIVEAGADGNGSVAAVSGGIERDPANDFPRLILASPHLASMRPGELSNLTDAIDRLADATQGAGGLDLADGEVSGRIRDGFDDHLSTWYRWYKREAATILELALWKIELDRSRGAFQDRAAGGGKRARTDAPTRDDCRRTCGAVPIVGLVLSSLAGPHRRVEQGGNAGSI